MALPKTMMAIAAERTEPGAKLVAKEILVPHPGPGQILIKVASAGVNRADLLQVQGHHPPPPGAPDTPGLEASGTVVAVDQAVSGIREAMKSVSCCRVEVMRSTPWPRLFARCLSPKASA